MKNPAKTPIPEPDGLWVVTSRNADGSVRWQMRPMSHRRASTLALQYRQGFTGGITYTVDRAPAGSEERAQTRVEIV